MHQYGLPPSPQPPLTNTGNAYVTEKSHEDIERDSPVKSAGLAVSFFWAKIPIYGDNGLPTGELRDKLCVAKAIIGDFKTVACKMISEEQAQRQFPREYAAFTQQMELPDDGTPLQELPGITQSQIGLMLLNHVRTVEQAAKLTEAQVSALGLVGQQVHDWSKRWLDMREGASEELDTTSELAALKAQLAHLSNVNDKFEKQTKEQQIQIDTLRQSLGQNVVPGGSDPSANRGIIMNSDDEEDFYGGQNPLADGDDTGAPLEDPLA